MQTKARIFIKQIILTFIPKNISYRRKQKKQNTNEKSYYQTKRENY